MLNNLFENFSQYKRIHDLDPQISKKEKKALKKGYPFQKILGWVNFDDLKIDLQKKVFIPRYETQELVNKVIPLIKPHFKVLDLCCGSGYIGLTIKQKTNADLTLVDNDWKAIKQSQKNAQLNNLKVTIIKSNLFKKIKKNTYFDLIIANPPYIPKNQKNKIAKSVLKHEPHKALFGGQDGNLFYKEILKESPKFLKPQGYIFFEISPDNVAFLKEKNFTIQKDINGKERIAFYQF